MVEVSLQSKSRQQYADVRSYVPYHDWKPGGGIPLQAGYGHSLNQITLPHRGAFVSRISPPMSAGCFMVSFKAMFLQWWLPAAVNNLGDFPICALRAAC
jgi:hypothetical protein